MLWHMWIQLFKALFSGRKWCQLKVLMKLKGWTRKMYFQHSHRSASSLFSACLWACIQCHRWTRYSLSFAEGQWYNMKARIACQCTAAGSRGLDHFLCAERTQFYLHRKAEWNWKRTEKEQTLWGLRERVDEKLSCCISFSLIPNGTIHVSERWAV